LDRDLEYVNHINCNQLMDDMPHRIHSLSEAFEMPPLR